MAFRCGQRSSSSGRPLEAPAKWFSTLAYPRVVGDRDIVAFHPRKRQYVIAKIEGSFSRQSEQKLYKAMGQIVMAASVDPILDWKTSFILVVHGEAIVRHLSRATALARLNISGLSLAIDPSDDEWPFGQPLR